MKWEEARLQFYRTILQSNPAFLSALDITARQTPQLPPDELLYLHVMAPTILEFTQWVINEAQRSGKKRLYFLARDAYPIFLAAKAICAADKVDIDCRYIKVSRYSLRMAEYYLLGRDCVERLCVGGIRVTLRKILARAGLDVCAEEIAAESGMQGLLDRELSYAEVMALKPRLRENELLQQAIRERSERAFPSVLGYLEQEGLLESIPYALVDSGWTGTLQQTLERLLYTKKKSIRLEGYYFGLYELPRGTDSDRYHSFFFSPTSGLGRKISFSNSLFEALCSAPHGMTVAYEKVGRRIEAVTAGDNLNRDRIERYCTLFERYVEAYCATPRKIAAPDCCPKLLCALMGRPQAWEVEAFGNLLFCDDVLEKTVQQAAAPLTDEEIRQQRFLSKVALMLGLKKGEIHESAWIEGSIVRNGNTVRSNLLHAKLYKTFVYMRKTIRQNT